MDIIDFNASSYGIKDTLLNGLNCYFIENKNKPKILLLHGAGGSSRVFFPFMKKLYDEGLEPWAVDLPGHGKSDSVDLKKIHVWDYVENIKSLIPLIKADFLLGHSMGGFIAQKLAINTPLKGIITLCSMPSKKIPLTVGKKWFIITLILLSWPIFLIGKYHVIRRFIMSRYSFSETPAKTREALITPFAKNKKRMMESPHFINDIRFSSYGKIEPDAIPCPFLVIGGKKDLLITYKTQEKIASFFKAPLVLLKDSGHMPIIEKELPLLTTTVSEFIKNSLKTN